MADEEKQEEAPAENENAEGQAAEGEDGEAPKKSPLKLILMIVVPIILLGGIGAGLFFTGIIGGKSEEELKAEAEKEAALEKAKKAAGPTIDQILMYELPNVLVNLKTTSKKRKPYLKLSIGLETVVEESKEVTRDSVKGDLDKLAPRIKDQFQLYLRELTASDLQGSSGMQRVREELLERANAVAKPRQFINVLFIEFLVQ